MSNNNQTYYNIIPTSREVAQTVGGEVVLIMVSAAVNAEPNKAIQKQQKP